MQNALLRRKTRRERIVRTGTGVPVCTVIISRALGLQTALSILLIDKEIVRCTHKNALVSEYCATSVSVFRHLPHHSEKSCKNRKNVRTIIYNN